MRFRSEKCLVISEVGLGDALTLLPPIHALKKDRPDVAVDMIAPGLVPLRENVKDVVRIMDPRPLAVKSDAEKLDWLRSGRYDAVWNTENERSDWRRILEKERNPRWISAPPHRDWPRRYVLELRMEQLRNLYPGLAECGPLVLEATPEQAREKAAFRSGFPKDEVLVAIQPGAKDKTKAWPPEKFVALARRLTALPDASVIFFLGPDERDGFERLTGDDPRILRIAEPLESLIPKLSACCLFVGNDSGFYHLAHALGLRTIGIYRSRRNMKVWSHRSDRSRAVCFYLPSPVRQYWKKCLSVNRVWKAAESMLKMC
jgi:ADP-heptose:LPS heptosyltransferase